MEYSVVVVAVVVVDFAVVSVFVVPPFVACEHYEACHDFDCCWNCLEDARRQSVLMKLEFDVVLLVLKMEGDMMLFS